jgi:hypothetical protein
MINNKKSLQIIMQNLLTETLAIKKISIEIIFRLNLAISLNNNHKPMEIQKVALALTK